MRKIQKSTPVINEKEEVLAGVLFVAFVAFLSCALPTLLGKALVAFPWLGGWG